MTKPRIGHNGEPPAKLEAIDAVLHDRRYSQTEALIMIGLIVRSDEEFRNAFPGGSTLAMYAKLKSTDAVFSALRRLESEYEVIRREKRGSGKSNAYCVLPMRVVSAIIEAYDQRRTETHPVQPGAQVTKPTPLNRVARKNPPVSTHPLKAGGSTPVAPQTHPSYAGGFSSTHPVQAGGLVQNTVQPTPLKPVGPDNVHIYKNSIVTESESVTTVESLLPMLSAPNENAATTKKPERRLKKRSQLPIDWTPTVEMMAWARDRFVVTDEQIKIQGFQFRDFHVGKGNLMADWGAAWRTWWGNGYHRHPRRGEGAKLSEVAPAAKDLDFERRMRGIIGHEKYERLLAEGKIDDQR